MKILDFAVYFNFALISLFVGYHMFFLIAYLTRRLFRGIPMSEPSSRFRKFAIIIPAHNEELMLRSVLESTKSICYPSDCHTVIVIADNCTDNTASIAREMNVKCFERHDTTNKGKPYALNWFFSQIDIDDHDAYVIIDADTLVDNRFLTALNLKMEQGHDIIQGYFGVLNASDTWVTQLAVIPGLFKFHIRYHVKTMLGLSCPLMGNGMCFSRAIISSYGWNAFSMTENWEYYVKLVLNNHVPTYAQDAVIYSHAALTLKHGETQRDRWLKGRLQTTVTYLPKLVIDGIREKCLVKLDAAMELILPSYSNLFSWAFLYLAIGYAMKANDLTPDFPSTLLTAPFALLVFFYLLCLITLRTKVKVWGLLPYIPLYLAWKIKVFTKALIGYHKKSWNKTERILK